MEHLTETTFAAAINQDDVIVDYYADWCGPCRALSPLLEKLADEKQVRVVKVDVDSEPRLSQAAQVFSIPTVIRYRQGEEVTRIIGLKPYNELVSQLT